MENENLKKNVTTLSNRMVKLADEGEKAARDDSCLVLYSIMKDSAYQIKNILMNKK